MEYKRFDNTYVLRCEIGEDLKEKITELAKKEDIRFATVTGIGACDDVELSIFYPDKKSYNHHQLKEELELVSLMGNISQREEEIHVHLHASFSNGFDKVYAGHLDRAIVCATAEIFIETKEDTLKRKQCEKTGLWVLDLQ